MFDIQLLKESEADLNGARLGKITIGNFVERFACYPIEVDDDVNELPMTWQQNLELLFTGCSKVKLDHDPRISWVVYREGETCFIQQIMFVDGVKSNIPERITVNEDGNSISEWSVNLEDISAFLSG